MASERVLVFEHHPLEHAGAYGQALAEAGTEVRRVRLHAGDPIPSLLPSDGLLIMGGPMSVRDRQRYPWIEAELDLVKEAMARDISLLGVCLGSQILAVAADATLFEGQAGEIGWYQVRFPEQARADPLFGDCPRSMSVFQWHREGFTLPGGATLLASTDAFPIQAFRVGTRAYGVLFHLEVTPAMVAAWRGAFAVETAPVVEPHCEPNYRSVNRLAQRIATRLFLS